MNTISIKGNYSEPVMELLAQGINVWIEDDLNFKKNACIPIEYFEKALKEANDSEKQELCDEISALYENLELHIIKQTIYHAYFGDNFKNYYFDLGTSFNRYGRMKELEKIASQNGQNLKLIEWSSLLKLIINTCIKECVGGLPVKNYNALFAENNCFDFMDIEQIERFSDLLYRMEKLVPVLDDDCKMFSSLDNYELFFKRFYSFGKLLLRLSKNTQTDLSAKHSIDRLINGIYTEPIEDTVSKIKLIEHSAHRFMSHIAFKNMNPNLASALKFSAKIWSDTRESLSKKVASINDELHETSLRYQTQIDCLCKKKNSIFSIFTSNETKQNLVNSITELENEKTKLTNELNEKISDAEKEYETTLKISEMFHKAHLWPLSDEIDWEMILENMQLKGKYYHIPNKNFVSEGDLIEFL